LKIGPHVPKLLSNIKGYNFLRHSVLQLTGHSNNNNNNNNT